MNKELLLSFNMIYEDYSLNSKKLILYPFIKRLNSMVYLHQHNINKYSY